MEDWNKKKLTQKNYKSQKTAKFKKLNINQKVEVFRAKNLD